MTQREQDILALLREDPMLPQQDIADRLGISRSAVAGHIMHLTNKGIIKGRGYVIASQPFVCAVGGANMDLQGKAATAITPQDSNPGAIRLSAGGVARNVAENLARLNLDCRLISAIGKDAFGRSLIQRTQSAGVDTQHVLEIDGGTTSTYLSIVDAAGDLQVAIADMSIIDSLTADALQNHRAMLKQAAITVIDANLSADALEWLTATLHKQTIFADTVSAAKAPRLRPHLASIHTLKLSVEEAQVLTGLAAGTTKQLGKVCRELHAQGVTQVFVSRGSKGVYFSTPNESGSRPPTRQRRAVESVSGAGDAFLAGLVYSALHDSSLSMALDFSLAAADLTLSHSQTNHPMLSEITIARAMEKVDVAS